MTHPKRKNNGKGKEKVERRNSLAIRPGIVYSKLNFGLKKYQALIFFLA
jgi:hypothetical protein